ncbi:Uncharacterised protein [Vibrio cholerae]|nr:Uncharacterised protein [Vibrio cholerae]
MTLNSPLGFSSTLTLVLSSILMPASNRGGRFGELKALKPSACDLRLRLPRIKRLLKNRVTSLIG